MVNVSIISKLQLVLYCYALLAEQYEYTIKCFRIVNMDLTDIKSKDIFPS